MRPEPAVLTDNSLHALAKEIDSDLRFIMMLCIPTTRIIQMKDDAGQSAYFLARVYNKFIGWMYHMIHSM